MVGTIRTPFAQRFNDVTGWFVEKTPNRTRRQSYNFPFSSLSGRLSGLLTILQLLFSYLKMMRTGMGYRFSQTNRRISTAGASNIVTRLASRTVTGQELPIPSTWGHLIPNSYCDVGRFPAGYLTFELNCAGIHSN